MSSTSALICGNVSSPTCSTRSESALVLAVSAAAQATRAPARSDSRASAASSGSTPTTRVPGSSALTATAMPDTMPPPPTGTRTAAGGPAPLRRSREVLGDLQADRALPGDHPPVVERRDLGVAPVARDPPRRLDPRRQRGRDRDQLRADAADQVGLDRRCGVRHDDRGRDPEQGGGVGDGESVVAARVRDHARRGPEPLASSAAIAL